MCVVIDQRIRMTKFLCFIHTPIFPVSLERTIVQNRKLKAIHTRCHSVPYFIWHLSPKSKRRVRRLYSVSGGWMASIVRKARRNPDLAVSEEVPARIPFPVFF